MWRIILFVLYYLLLLYKKWLNMFNIKMYHIHFKSKIIIKRGFLLYFNNFVCVYKTIHYIVYILY